MSDRLQQLQGLFEKDPKDPFLTYAIAIEHGKTGALADAVTWLDKTLEIDGKYCYAFYQKALMVDQLGDRDGAKAVLEAGMVAAQEAGDAHAADEMRELMSTLG